ncbi:MAG: procyclic acidic repetitive family protein [Dehalococcoidia bacterium]|nr:procyclic acidic repetitive family protein [Dehalococcoidia bacterium]
MAIAAAVLSAAVLIACEVKEPDCENDGDQQEYEACLTAQELRHENQTATAAAEDIIRSTEVAEARAEFMTVEALSDEDYEATTVALDELAEQNGGRQSFKRAAGLTALNGSAPVTTTGDTTGSDSTGMDSGNSTDSVEPAPERSPAPVDTPTPVPASITAAPTPVPSATAMPTPGPTAIPTPEPTATPVPEPTATEGPVDLSTLAWLTGLQAGELAFTEAGGRIYEIVGHVSEKAGMLSSGDTAGDELSPGAGYGRDWSVTVHSGEEKLYCSVSLGVTDCSGGFTHNTTGDVTAVVEDSSAAFERFESENNADWQTLLANDDISILFHLKVDLGDTPADAWTHVWSASITVHDEGASPGGGNFAWNIEKDTVTSSVY